MKQHLTFIFIFISIFIFGCGDRSNLDILHGAGPDLGENTVYTELPPEVWETIRRYRDNEVENHEIFRNRYLGTEHYTAEDEQVYAELIAEAAALKEREKAYYNRYIDADGIAIVGNSHTPDKYFVDAKNIILIMTSKHPDLRNQLRGLWYFDIFLAGPDSPNPPRANQFYTIASGTCAEGNYIQDGQTVWQRWPITGIVEIGWCAAVICECWPDSPMAVFIHEFAHALEERISDIDPTFHNVNYLNVPNSSKLVVAYETAIEKKTWEGSYAESNYREYWAVMVEFWFLSIGEGLYFETYEDFAAHDPLAYELLDEWFPKVSFWGLQ